MSAPLAVASNGGTAAPAAAAAAAAVAPEQRAALAIVSEHLKDVVLDPDAKDAIIDTWLGASREERIMIAMLYPLHFKDAGFVQRIHARATLRNAALAAKTPGSGASARATPVAADNDDAGGNNNNGRPASRSNAAALGSNNKNNNGKRGGGGVVATTPSGATALPEGVPKPLSHAARTLRTLIDNAVAKLPPNSGPHRVRFGVVSDATLNQQAISLYSRQFTHPEPPMLKQIVTVPRRTTKRTRSNPVGNFTWFIWCDTTLEMCCVVTVTVHAVDTFRFIEMPLFATESGYKRVGLGRLLNAALQEYCADIKAAFILVSADQNAVDFWCSPSMGYQRMPRDIESRVSFMYKTECNQFEGSVLLTWQPPAGPTPSLVQRALARSPLLTLAGSSVLSLP